MASSRPKQGQLLLPRRSKPGSPSRQAAPVRRISNPLVSAGLSPTSAELLSASRPYAAPGPQPPAWRRASTWSASGDQRENHHPHPRNRGGHTENKRFFSPLRWHQHQGRSRQPNQRARRSPARAAKGVVRTRAGAFPAGCCGVDSHLISHKWPMVNTPTRAAAPHDSPFAKRRPGRGTIAWLAFCRGPVPAAYPVLVRRHGAADQAQPKPGLDMSEARCAFVGWPTFRRLVSDPVFFRCSHTSCTDRRCHRGLARSSLAVREQEVAGDPLVSAPPSTPTGAVSTWWRRSPPCSMPQTADQMAAAAPARERHPHRFLTSPCCRCPR